MPIHFLTTLTLFAAFNDGAYGAWVYGDSSTASPVTPTNPGTSTTANNSSILAPLTGFVREQPPYVLGGLLIFVVVMCALIARYAYSRLSRR